MSFKLSLEEITYNIAYLVFFSILITFIGESLSKNLNYMAKYRLFKPSSIPTFMSLYHYSERTRQ